MPVDLIIVRAKDIPKVIFDGSSIPAVGITGSDILWEAGLENVGEEVPIYYQQGTKRPSMYFGVYPGFENKYSKLEDLDGQIIATKYPRITQDTANRRGINVNTREFSGGIEGRNNLYPFLVGLMDIINSGNTAKVNGIKILEIFYKVSARMIDAPGKMTPMELAVFEDLQELIAVALQRKRMV